MMGAVWDVMGTPYVWDPYLMGKVSRDVPMPVRGACLCDDDAERVWRCGGEEEEEGHGLLRTSRRLRDVG